jgi:hypothetical protein
MPAFDKADSGLKGLDELVQYIRLGDNVVWQIDDLKDYQKFVTPFVQEALQKKTRVVYLRFAEHPPLLTKQKGLRIFDLSGLKSFESFTVKVHQIINKEGREVFYVFDCLSALLNAWATDLMIGNFFVVTCPLLFELDTIAYFGIYRQNHSAKTIARIRDTTQLLLDVYSLNKDLYVHPLKVWKRYSSTMFLPHLAQGDVFKPITDSSKATRLLTHIYRQGTRSDRAKVDFWDRLLIEAKALTRRKASAQSRTKMFKKLCELMLGRETKMLKLIQTHLTLEDLVEIMDRLIGSGYIGGKTVGMLVSRKVLMNDKSFPWSDILEDHDSFYIGSDVFYTYIVQNGLWKLWLQHKSKANDLQVAQQLKEQMLKGQFPEEILEKFQELVEYFGQAPIILRSSSLLEDSYGNAFAGKYESIFVVNQGTPEGRLHIFTESVQRIFASTMNEDALAYRSQRGLAGEEEQMALLVQRVSGAHKQKYFFPDLAGVGISYNTFLWKEGMDPQAGMLRLVLGLGTRAVNRVEDDYPRIVALDQPLLKPHASKDDTRKYSQHKVDLLNKKVNIWQTVALDQLVEEKVDLKLERLAEKDHELITLREQYAKDKKDLWLLTFDELLSGTAFASNMQRMLKTIEKAYQFPVDIEFTGNFNEEGELKINLLQCRPFQATALGSRVALPENTANDQLFFRSNGFFIGGNIDIELKQIIFIEPEAYGQLKETQKYDIARAVGRLNREQAADPQKRTMLVGPGRWGASMPAMGVPVSFAEINNFKAIVETSYPLGDLQPELSMGSHFFQDLIETNIYYVALFLEKENVFLDKTWLDAQANLLVKVLPEYAKYEKVVKICAVDLRLISDIITQRIFCLK